MLKEKIRKILILLFIFVIPFLSGCSSTPSSNTLSGPTSGPAIDIEDYEVTELTIVTNPTKTNYNVGELFDYTGMRLKAVWNDGEEETFGAFRCDSIEPSTPLKVSDTIITCRYYNATVTLNIVINSNQITAITADLSGIEERVVNNTIVDLSQVKLVATYEDESTQEVTGFTFYENGEKIESPNRYLVSEGKHQITIKYLDKETTFEITAFDGIYGSFVTGVINGTATEATEDLPFFVEEPNLVDTYVETKVDGTTEWVFAEDQKAYQISASNGLTKIHAFAKIRIHMYSYKNSYAKIMLNAGGYNLTSPHNSKTSDMYLSKVATLTVNGVPTAIKEGLLPKNHDGTDYLCEKWTPYFVNVDFCETWLKQGDNILEINVNETYYKIDPFQGQRYGEVYFAIKSLTAEYFQGVKKVNSLEITKMPTKTTYEVGETFDSTGLEITAHYDDFTSGVITDYVLDKTILKATDIYVTAYYQDKTVQIPIKVNHTCFISSTYSQDSDYHWRSCTLCGDKQYFGAHTFSEIKIASPANSLEYLEGDVFSLDGLVVIVNCSVCENVDITSLVSSSLEIGTIVTKTENTIVPETKRVTLSYQNLSTYFDIKIYKAYVVQASNRQDPATTNEKYFVEQSVQMENGKSEYSISNGVMISVNIGATLSFHIYSDFDGKANLMLEAAPQYCMGVKTAEGHYTESLDMVVENVLSLRVKNGDADYVDVASKEGAVLQGSKLPEDYEELATTYVLYAMKKNLIAENIDLVKGDNIIEITILNSRNLGGYRDAWNGTPTFNLKSVSAYFVN